MPGVTTAGLEIATIADVRADIAAQWREAFGASMDVSDRSPDGQLIGIHGEIFALLWELLEVVAGSMDKSKATGQLLRALVALTGTVEIPPTFSTVTLTLTGVPTSPVTTGTLVSTVSTEQQFTTTEDVTIAAATAWAGATAYVVDDRRTNASNVYLCVVAGTSAASGGPVGEDPDPDVQESDGTAAWRFLGEGTGFVDVAARATATGPIVAIAGDLIAIDSPTGGLQGVTNILDAEPGRSAMSDAELRALSDQELARPGTSPPDAVRAALLRVGEGTQNPVTACTVFTNNTDITDSDGVPPHTLEAVVQGGEDQDIWNALLANVAGGIRTHGTEVGTATDSKGVAHTMAFSRTTELIVYVAVTLVKNPATYPADGDDQVKTAIATVGNAKDDGTDVVSSAVLARVFAVPGVISVDLPLISQDPVTVPVATTTIAVSTRQRAVFDTTRITVTSSDGVP